MSLHILIAGCGDLGVRAARRLLAQGHAVWGLRRQPPAVAEPGLQWVAADLGDTATLAAVPRTITHLLYCPTPEKRELAAYRASFLLGLQNVVGAVGGGLRRTVFVSSSAVYGEHDGAWVDEATPPAPLGYNGRILLEAEQWLAMQTHSTVALRLAGLYGPGRLQLLQRLRNGEARAPGAARPHWANRMHIDDAAAAAVHLLTLDDPHATYIGADDTPLPLHILYGYLARKMGAPEVQPGSAPSNVGSKRLSNARLRASGLNLQWPDARIGYAALLDPDSDSMRTPEPRSGRPGGMLL